MNKLRVGIVIDPFNTPTRGGTFSYYHTLLYGINDFDFDDNIEFVNIVFYKRDQPDLRLTKPSIFIRTSYAFGLAQKMFHDSDRKKYALLLRENPTIRYLYEAVKNIKKRKVEKLLAANRVDLLYYLQPEGNILNYPFIATHWDVGHRSTYPFPEVALNSEYEIRENYYVNVLNKALLILCESEAGAGELRKYYSFFDKKIKVMPMFGGSIMNIEIPPHQQEETLLKYKLKKERFFLYPAQFWALKNHYNLLQAYSKFRSARKDEEVKLVLCGSDKGNLNYIRQTIQDLSLEDSVLIQGFVPDHELNAFYRNATALVMPTFLGPTNMPLIEAARLHCPVLCSDLEGHREILGKHALYFDPADPDSIVHSMKGILDETDRDAWTNAAFRHISLSPFNLSYSLSVLNETLLKITPIRKTWGWG